MKGPIFIILILFLLNTCSSPEDKLFRAVRENNLNQVKQLLNISLNINTRDSKGRTPLHIAFQNGNIPIVRILLKQKADINAQDRDGRTPLHLLFLNNTKTLRKKYNYDFRDEIIKLLTQYKPQYNTRDQLGRTIFHYIALNRHIKFFYRPIRSHIKVNLKDNQGKTAYDLASNDMKSHIESAGALKGEDWSVYYYPLLESARDGDLNKLKSLLEKGANINAKDDVHESNKLEGYTPLLYAASNGHLHIILYLISKGVKVNYHTLGGYTALYYAAENGHYKVVQYLLSKGATANIHSACDALMPLDRAVQNGYADIAKLLVQHGGTVSQYNMYAECPLAVASLIGDYKMALSSIQNRHNIDRNNVNGNTPLHSAVKMGHVSIIKLLLIHGASPYIKNNKNQTPLDLATDKKIRELLLKHGAKSGKKIK